MKKTMNLVVFAILFLVTAQTVMAQVVVAPPAPGYNNHGYRPGYSHGPYGHYPYQPRYVGPGAPFYNNYYNNYGYQNYNYSYPRPPYMAQYPYYFAPQATPYWMPQQFYYPQQVFVCSVRGLNTGLYYTGWGVTADVAQNYASLSCSNSEGAGCVFFSCIVR